LVKTQNTKHKTDKKEPTMAVTFITPEFRASYVFIFTPKLNTSSGKEEHSMSMIFPKGTDLKPMKAAALKAAKEKFGDKAEALVKGSSFKWPFKDGNADRPGDEAYADSTFVSCKNQKRVGVVDKFNTVITSEEEFFSGCYAVAQVNFAAYDHATGGKGVGVYLNAVQMKSKGDSLGGGMTDATKVFEAAPEGEASEGEEFFE
jgi:hypothetical protein